MSLETVREKWAREYLELEAFGVVVRDRVRAAVSARGIWCDVQSRPKGIDSILKKLIKKTSYTYETLPDLVGVRVIVRYLPEVDRIIEMLPDFFTCGEPDNKAVRLAEDGVGYLSWHRDARLKTGDADHQKYPSDRFHAEVQVRTLAQHLWAEMSHDAFYKAESDRIAGALKRRINLMAGLLEVADAEFTRLSGEVAEIPDMAELKVLHGLESKYYQFVSERSDSDLSLLVIKLLLPLYDEEPGAVTTQVSAFADAHRDTIVRVFAEQWKVPEDRSAFLFQPEVLMIYERLDRDLVSLREKWSTLLPEPELERVALVFGYSFD